MILTFTFEEIGALKHGAEHLLGERSRGEIPVAAPPEGWEEVVALLPRLSGDLAIETLTEQRTVRKAVVAIVAHLKAEMDHWVMAAHPADESAVSSYFLYANALGVLARLTEMGQEMEALIELVTGAPVTREVAATFLFPH